MIYDINYQGRKISDRYSVVAKFITVDFFILKHVSILEII